MWQKGVLYYRKECVACFMSQGRNRTYHSREEMERQRELRRRRAMQKRRILKRRIYFCMLLILLLTVLLLLLRWKKGSDSLSGNTVSEGRAVSENTTISGETLGIPSSQLPISGERYDTVSGSSLLDVTGGTAVVDFSTVSENKAGIAEKAKQAMAGQAHFTGSNITVNEAFSVYGSGEWHALVNQQDDICVFYTGERDGVTFRINFEIYEDGTFVLVSASRGGEEIEDFAGFVMGIVRR